MKANFIMHLKKGLILYIVIFCSCRDNENHKNSDQTAMKEGAIINPVVWQGIKEAVNLQSFIGQTHYPDGSHNNEKHATGIILSPYYRVETYGERIPAYTVPVSEGGTHSFSTVLVNEKAFPIKLRLTVTFSAGKVNVLPESHGVKASLSGKTVEADIPAPGSYSFVFDEKQDDAFTLFVHEHAEFVAPDGYEVVKMKPGDYGRLIAESNKVLYFETGVHTIDRITVLNNSAVYFEPGAFIDARQPTFAETPTQNPDWAGQTAWGTFISGTNVSGVKIWGAGMIDHTRLDWHARSCIRFTNCSNIEIDGLMINNTTEWTVTFMNSSDVAARNLKVFGYRQNSDGVNICSRRNAVVEDCFVRAGDDTYCVKTYNLPVKAENIVFRNNVSWPDKCRGMGIVHETETDITNVRFEHCCVVFAPATWADFLGALVVVVAGPAEVSGIYFDDIEIYSVNQYSINISILNLDPTNTVETNYRGGKIHDIHFNNIRFNGTAPIRLCGTDGAKAIDKIYFDGISRNGKLCTSTTDLRLRTDGIIGDIYLNTK